MIIARMCANCILAQNIYQPTSTQQKDSINIYPKPIQLYSARGIVTQYHVSTWIALFIVSSFISNIQEHTLHILFQSQAFSHYVAVAK